MSSFLIIKYKDTPPQVVVSKINKVVREAGLRQTVKLRWEASQISLLVKK